MTKDPLHYLKKGRQQARPKETFQAAIDAEKEDIKQRLEAVGQKIDPIMEESDIKLGWVQKLGLRRTIKKSKKEMRKLLNETDLKKLAIGEYKIEQSILNMNEIFEVRTDENDLVTPELLKTMPLQQKIKLFEEILEDAKGFI